MKTILPILTITAFHLFVYSTRSNDLFFLLIYPKILDYQVFETNDAFYYLFNVFRSGAPSYI